MPEMKNDNNNIIQPSQVPRKIGKDENLPQKSDQNNVNAFDYNNPPNNHSLDSKYDEQVEKNKKPKSRWKYYLLFFVGLLTIGGGIALAVVASPWCGFICLAGLIMCAVGIIGWNGAEQQANLPYNQEVEKKNRDENEKEKGKSNEISKEQNQDVEKGTEETPVDFASMLKNMEDEVKNEEEKNANNNKIDNQEEPNEIVETAKAKPEKSKDDMDKKVDIVKKQPPKMPLPDMFGKKEQPIQEKKPTDNQPDMKGIADLFNPSKITDKNNDESKNNLKTNNQAKEAKKNVKISK